MGRVEAVGYEENDRDAQIVSELMDNIRDAVTDYQVSGDYKLFLQVIEAIGIDGTPTGHI